MAQVVFQFKGEQYNIVSSAVRIICLVRSYATYTLT